MMNIENSASTSGRHPPISSLDRGMTRGYQPGVRRDSDLNGRIGNNFSYRDVEHTRESAKLERAFTADIDILSAEADRLACAASAGAVKCWTLGQLFGQRRRGESKGRRPARGRSSASHSGKFQKAKPGGVAISPFASLANVQMAPGPERQLTGGSAASKRSVLSSISTKMRAWALKAVHPRTGSSPGRGADLVSAGSGLSTPQLIDVMSREEFCGGLTEAASGSITPVTPESMYRVPSFQSAPTGFGGVGDEGYMSPAPSVDNYGCSPRPTTPVGSGAQPPRAAGSRDRYIRGRRHESTDQGSNCSDESGESACPGANDSHAGVADGVRFSEPVPSVNDGARDTTEGTGVDESAKNNDMILETIRSSYNEHFEAEPAHKGNRHFHGREAEMSRTRRMLHKFRIFGKRKSTPAWFQQTPPSMTPPKSGKSDRGRMSPWLNRPADTPDMSPVGHGSSRDASLYSRRHRAMARLIEKRLQELGNQTPEESGSQPPPKVSSSRRHRSSQQSHRTQKNTSRRKKSSRKPERHSKQSEHRRTLTL